MYVILAELALEKESEVVNNANCRRRMPTSGVTFNVARGGVRQSLQWQLWHFYSIFIFS